MRVLEADVILLRTILDLVGRPAVVVCSVRDRVKDMVNCDRRITVRSIADELDV